MEIRSIKKSIKEYEPDENVIAPPNYVQPSDCGYVPFFSGYLPHSILCLYRFIIKKPQPPSVRWWYLFGDEDPNEKALQEWKKQLKEIKNDN